MSRSRSQSHPRPLGSSHDVAGRAEKSGAAELRYKRTPEGGKRIAGCVSEEGNRGMTGEWSRDQGPVLLLPATTQGLVELNQSDQFVRLRLRQSQLGGEGIRLVGQHFQVIGGSGLEAHVRESRRILG
jgi:hypothetical protein